MPNQFDSCFDYKMMSREGTSEAASAVAPSPPSDVFDDELLPWQGQRVDEDDGAVGSLDEELSPPSSSRYSSCGESEFERYCSANSVMGTPSLCSSVGSVRSLRVGDMSGLDNFSLGGRFERNAEDKRTISLGRLGEPSQKYESSSDPPEGTMKRHVAESGETFPGLEMNSFEELRSSFADLNTDLSDEGGIIRWGDHINSKAMQRSINDGSRVWKGSEQDIKEHILDTEVGVAGAEGFSQPHMGIVHVKNEPDSLTLGPGLEFAEHENGKYSDEGETSSRCEHSEGEDSMYGYGTNDEKQISSFPMKHTQYSQKVNGNDENSLLMTSSVAYGPDDWDDFIQETMENPRDPLVLDKLQGQHPQGTEPEVKDSDSTLEPTIQCPITDPREEKEDVKDIPFSNEVQVANDLAVNSEAYPMSPINILTCDVEEQGEIVKDRLVTASQIEAVNLLKIDHDSPIKKKPSIDGLHWEPKYTSSNIAAVIDAANALRGATEEMAGMLKGHKQYPLSEPHAKKIEANSVITSVLVEEHPQSSKIEDHELKEYYYDIVHEMEEILLDTSDTPADRIHFSQVPPPLRDGGSTASTSSMDDAHLMMGSPLRIDGVEVVGARQKKGEVSLSERLVGVKEYTVYKLRVWSGNNHWEVERRYRDFFTLYRRLKTSFTNQGWTLPSPWLSVERESRKIFGIASPDVIAERSILIQECLQSILNSNFSSTCASSLIWFLSPPKDDHSSYAFGTHTPQSPTINRETVYSLGQTISLIVEIRPHRAMVQMLEAQHYTCAGCHKHFDDGKTRIWDFVQTFGWGKPRFCEYSGQVFCSSCHINETAVLPARVLNFWDFTEYPVSQLAKSYLDSIHDQPMLCVSAVNPFLFSKVPALQHVTNVRKRIGSMLPYVHCPFRRSLFKALGARRYILESNDFFALKDLIDLSKGVFAALPAMVETVSRKILVHITDRCLVCYDAGVPCNARRACDDPSSLIFPFQEGEVQRCTSCEMVFHKRCFKKIGGCPCRSTAKGNPSTGNEVDSTLNLSMRKASSNSSVGFLSGLFSKASPSKLSGNRDNGTVILMGSLPNTSL